MKPEYDRWRKRLAGSKTILHEIPEAEDCGFYRVPIREQVPLKNGQGLKWKVVGWKRAALMVYDNDLVGVINGQIIQGNELADQWLWMAPHPIPEKWYRDVEAGVPWPDSHEDIPVADEDNKISPAARIDIQVERAEELLAQFQTIDSDEQASKARSLQNTFLDLKSQAEKNYEEVNRPLLDEQKRLRGIWFCLRDRADEASKTLRKAMGAWEDTKRKAAKVAAERAEAGQDNAASNVPPPSTQIRGGAGRAAAVRVEKVVTDVDVMKVADQFKDSPVLREFLIEMAQRAIRAGVAVPGATYEEKSVVR